MINKHLNFDMSNNFQMQIELHEIKEIYNYLKQNIKKNIEYENWNKALNEIENAAKIANKFNWIYCDTELENYIETISRKLLINKNYKKNKKHIVFFDSWGIPNRGLTLQYLTALKYGNYKVLYIFEKENQIQVKRMKDIVEKEYEFEVFSLENSNRIERITILYQLITNFGADIVLMHITPWAVDAITVFHSLSNVVKYQINLTDHAFWLGSKCLDYCIEFRDYGYSISSEKRFIDESKLCYCPYYPIVVENEYKGLPIQIKDRIIILSGSSYYKIYGRKKAFFNILHRLLVENPEVIILFAGNGDGRILRNFIKKNNFNERIILLGSRNDIGEIFDRCDIYLSTYPISGGLMAQIAALKAKPILAFTTPDIQTNIIDDLVSYNNRVNVTCMSEESFYKRASRLIKNQKLRINYGKNLKKGLIRQEQFNINVMNILEKSMYVKKLSKISISYSAITNLYLEVENGYQDQFKRLFFKIFGFKAALLFPKVFIKSIPALIRVITKSSSVQ